MEKMRLQEELKLSFWYRCKALVMTIREFWCSEQLTCHGHSILQSDVVLKEESIFLFLSMKLGISLLIKVGNA